MGCLGLQNVPNLNRLSFLDFSNPPPTTHQLPSIDVLVSAVARLPRGPLLKRGSTISLVCNATVTTTGPAQPQVQWLRWPLPVKGQSAPPDDGQAKEAEPQLVAALTHDGVAKIFANSSEVSVDRLSTVSYRLRVHTATMDDQGLYVCHAEAWGQDPHGGWYNTGVKARSNVVTVYLYARGRLASSFFLPS